MSDQPQITPNEKFRMFSKKASDVAGSFWSFLIAFGIVIIWGLTGPIYHYSDTWQLIINTGTTIVTFLMVFLIQNTQSRDSRAIHLKLDELIRSTGEARNNLINIEEVPDDEMKELHVEFSEIQQEQSSDPSKPKIKVKRKLKQTQTERTTAAKS